MSQILSVSPILKTDMDHHYLHTSTRPTPRCLQLLEILVISWNLTDPLGNFCVRCRRSTALVSSHKNMDKYSLQKIRNLSPSDVFFHVPDAPRPVFGQGSAPDPCGGSLWRSPRLLFGCGELKYPYCGYFISALPSRIGMSEGGRSKANMSWIFLEIPPGISWKFAWLNL